MNLLKKRLGTRETMRLLRNLQVSLRAGISLSQALGMLSDDTHYRFRKTVISLKKSVESGNTLSKAMNRAPYGFPPMVLSLVHTGEIGGTLEQSFGQIVEYLHTSAQLKQKVKSAMMYPTFVLIAIMGLGLSIGTFVLPELIPLFDSLDIELPLLTKLLLYVARHFQEHGLITAVAIATLVLGFILLRRVDAVKPILHRITLHIPYIGSIIKKSAIAQMAETLSMLLASGIPIYEAVKSAADSTENRVYRSLLSHSLRYIEKGRSLSDALSGTNNIPSIGISIISVGEQTGTLAESLHQLSEYYTEEADYAVKNLTTALEPALLITIGIMVGATVLAIITPIYEVTGSIR